MRHLTSMEMDDEDKLDFSSPLPMARPDFPCGLRICLTEKELDKLGVQPTAEAVGNLVHLFAMARVTSLSHHTNDAGDDCCRVELQIEDLSLEDESEED